MDDTRFDALARVTGSRWSRRQATGLLVLLGFGTAWPTATEARTTCKKRQKKCGKRCISKARCCKSADCPAGSGLICRKNACTCPNGEKACAATCIPNAAVCCTSDANCAATDFCAGNQCVTGSGNCATVGTACGAPGQECVCIANSPGQLRCVAFSLAFCSVAGECAAAGAGAACVNGVCTLPCPQ